jgi:hypothetical protein
MRLPKVRDKIEMLSSGFGEFNGTSTMLTPARSNEEQIASTSDG